MAGAVAGAGGGGAADAARRRRHVAGRLRWAREARAAEALRGAAGSEALLALRALAHRPLPELRRVAADPYRAFASGDHAALADLERRALGLRRV